MSTLSSSYSTKGPALAPTGSHLVTAKDEAINNYIGAKETALVSVAISHSGISIPTVPSLFRYPSIAWQSELSSARSLQ